MAATTWYPLWSQTRRHWRLTDGSIIVEPELEQSTSGRRIRLPGAKKSYANHEAESLAFTAAADEAARKGQRIVCQHFQNQPEGAHPVFSNTAGPWFREPTLHVLENPSTPSWSPTSKRTTYYWHYRCAEVPQIQAVVEIVIDDRYAYGARGSKRGVITHLHTTTGLLPQQRRSDPANAEELLPGNPAQFNATDEWFNSIDHGANEELRQWQDKSWAQKEKDLGVDPGTLDWLSKRDPDLEFVAKDKATIAEALRRVQAWDEIDRLTVPNWAKIAWPEACQGQDTIWTLELVKTNVTNDVIENLVAVIQGHDDIAAALEHFQAMQKALRSSGLVLTDVKAADLLRLLGNVDERFTVDVANVVYDGDAVTQIDAGQVPVDHKHKLSVDLVSGAFVVSCSQRAVDDDALLTKSVTAWEEARAVASITGEEPELLAFARLHAAREQDRSHEALVNAFKHN